MDDGSPPVTMRALRRRLGDETLRMSLVRQDGLWRLTAWTLPGLLTVEHPDRRRCLELAWRALGGNRP